MNVIRNSVAWIHLEKSLDNYYELFRGVYGQSSRGVYSLLSDSDEGCTLVNLMHISNNALEIWVRESRGMWGWDRTSNHLAWSIYYEYK